MPQSPDDLSKFVVKTKVSSHAFQDAASALADDVSITKGAVFNPMEAVSSGMRTGNALYELLKIACQMLARGIIAPVELLLRRRFGERYFNGIVFASFLFCYVLSMTFLRIDYIYCNTVLIEFIVLISINGWLCFSRDRKGNYWHSYSEGESLIRVQKIDKFFAQLNFTFDVSKLFIEPLVTVLAGIVCLLFPNDYISLGFESFRMNPFALYLMVAGVVMFIYQLFCYMYRRNLLLDEKDNEVIAEIRSKIASPSETAGVFSYKGVSYTVLGGRNDW